MKRKLIVALALCLFNFSSFGQKFVIEKSVASNTFKAEKGLICSNQDRTKWFAIQLIYKPNTNNVVVDGFKVIKSNIGLSNGKGGDLMVFTFTDGTNIKVKSRGALLEDLTTEFEVTNKDVDALLNKTVVSIRYINGEDYKSMTYYTVGDEKKYFINAFRFYKIKIIKE